MRAYDYGNLQSFLDDWKTCDKYFDMLRLMAQLSQLFSDSEVPYLDYRLAENLFCRYYKAVNDARSCTAYDARFPGVGIGIKTFILKHNDQSVEKIAEFNKLKKTLDGLKGLELAQTIGRYRNERMQFANNQYGVAEAQYHIVGRKERLLRVFNCPYEEVDVGRIHLVSDDETSCKFEDERNEYVFNKSKSVLMKRFCVPEEYRDVSVDIMDDPLELLERFVRSERAKESDELSQTRRMVAGLDYVILPLYSVKAGMKYVPEKSGLNQFNAGGRKRNSLEVYIPVPSLIHKRCPDFFPGRDEPFVLEMPDGTHLSAKICQDGGKALMSNPNMELGRWLLRKVLRKREWELVTIEDLYRLDFDSVCVEKLKCVGSNGEMVFRMSFSNFGESYATFSDGLSELRTAGKRLFRP